MPGLRWSDGAPGSGSGSAPEAAARLAPRPAGEGPGLGRSGRGPRSGPGVRHGRVATGSTAAYLGSISFTVKSEYQHQPRSIFHKLRHKDLRRNGCPVQVRCGPSPTSQRKGTDGQTGETSKTSDTLPTRTTSKTQTVTESSQEFLPLVPRRL